MTKVCQACGRILVHDRGPMCNGDVCLKTGKKWKPPERRPMIKPLKKEQVEGVYSPPEEPEKPKPKVVTKYNFEQFTKYGYSVKPLVSVWKSNSKIHINGGCLRKFKLGNFEYALLFFDEDNRAVGIRFVIEKSRDTFKLTNHGGGKVLHAATFFKTFDIGIKKQMKYPLEFNEELNLFIFHLEGGMPMIAQAKKSVVGN